MIKILVLSVFLTGCVCFDSTHRNLLKERDTKPPIVNTGGVKDQIDGTRDELAKVEESSQGINKSVDKAQNLAKRTDKILEELEKQQK